MGSRGERLGVGFCGGSHRSPVKQMDEHAVGRSHRIVDRHCRGGWVLWARRWPWWERQGGRTRRRWWGRSRHVRRICFRRGAGRQHDVISEVAADAVDVCSGGCGGDDDGFAVGKLEARCLAARQADDADRRREIGRAVLPVAVQGMGGPDPLPTRRRRRQARSQYWRRYRGGLDRGGRRRWR